MNRPASDETHHDHAMPNKPATLAQGAVDFLPAALAILEKPPSPAGRLLGYALIVLFGIAILWACLGKVDVVASADGKIIPSSRVKSIQALQKGVVNDIFVQEGQRVEKGQALIELDQTLTGADKARLVSDIAFLTLSLRRERALRDVFDQEASATPNTLFSEQTLQQAWLKAMDPRFSSHDDHLSQAQFVMVRQRWQDYRSQVAIINSQIASKKSQQHAVQARIQGLQTTIPLISKRVDALKQLHDSGMGAEVQLLELTEQQITQQQALAAEKARAQQVQAEFVELQQTLIAQKNTVRLANLQEIESLEQQRNRALEELNKANDLYNKQILVSPVKGRVKQLAVHTIGGVVEEAKVLLQIVPEDTFLEVEAVLQNKDIGFIHEGQRAEIKIHTFPFTKYGVIDAEVIGITADAIETERQGLIYTVRLAMQDTQLWVDKKPVELIPGMAVTAEVKTNQRRLIEFFMSPLLRYKDESIRER